jgi:uncharacterized protein involved in outer membrane biogenesis
VSHYFDLHELTARARADEALQLKLNGTVERSFPYQIQVTGGPLQDLLRGGQPWPIHVDLAFLSSTLTLDGAVAADRGDVRFGLGTASLSEFERLFQIDLPPVGAAALAGRIEFDAQRVSLSQLAATMGRTSLVGDLTFDYGAARPRLTGSLQLPTMDLRPFLTDEPAAREAIALMAAPPKTLADTYRELAQASFNLAQLNGIDADLRLEVGDWLSLPGDVRDAAMHVQLENGRLQIPMRITVAGVAMSGSAQADATTEPPSFAMSLATQESDLGGLAQLLTGVPGIKGRVGRFELRVGARGDQVSELTRTLDVRLQIERGQLSYGNVEGGRPVSFSLDRLDIALPAGRNLRGDLRGGLLGRPFHASLSGGALEPMMLEGRSAVDFQLQSGQLRARIRGTLQEPTRQHGPDFAFELSAPRASAAASWLGLTAASSEAAIRLDGQVALRDQQWRLDPLHLRLGRSAMTVQVAQRQVEGRPLIVATLSADNIDVKEIEALVPKSEKQERTGPVLDIPVLPQSIDLTDADVQVRLQRFEGSPLQVANVVFDGRIRDGYMHPSSFSVDVGEAHFVGAILLDLRGQDPEAKLWLSADDVDIGKLLRTLNLAANMDARLDLLRLYLATRSSRLGGMLERGDLTGTFAGGRLTLRDPNTKGEARIGLQEGLLRAEPGAPVRLNLDGSLDDIPVTIGLETAPARELADPQRRLPFKLTAQTAETRLALSGAVARPLGNKEVELGLELQGSRFSTLSRLVRASLPPWGPWSAEGKFRMSPLGYEVADLRLRVGDSELTGSGRLETTLKRPRLEISLHAPNVQLDDFALRGWSPVESRPEEAKSKEAGDVRERAARASDDAQRLLSPEVLGRQDAFLSVRVDQVLSGADKLGSGELQAKLQDGRADIGPIEVQIPGGSARLAIGYQPTESDVQVDLRLLVRKFDYGILARRIKPDTDLRGIFSANVDVTSRARYLSEVLRHGSGEIDFAIWPQNMKSGIFDLWAVNVLVALVPAVDPGKESHVNCAIGRFSLKDGQLAERSIVLDTTRMRVLGAGSADFKSEKISLRLQPASKSAQFFSLATPVQVTGTFTDFKIGVSPGDVAETVGRLATSIFWVPLQKMFGKKIPPDGADVCQAPLELLETLR